MSKELKVYREQLIQTKDRLNESYDKLLITLSGGALGVSITFLKDIIGTNNIKFPELLLIAWGLFVACLTFVLGEILFGIKARKNAINQVDNETIYEEKAGGKSSNISGIFHWIAALSLITGLTILATFAYLNIGTNYDGQKTTTTNQTTTKAK